MLITEVNPSRPSFSSSPSPPPAEQIRSIYGLISLSVSVMEGKMPYEIRYSTTSYRGVGKEAAASAGVERGGGGCELRKEGKITVPVP